MTTIALTFYELGIKERGRTGKFKDIKTLADELKSFLDVLCEFYNSLPQYNSSKLKIVAADKGGHPLCIESVKKADKALHGMVRSGETGFASEFFDIKTGQKNYNRKPDDIEMLPFCFYVDAPDNKKKVIIAVQSFGVYGVAHQVNSRLRKHLRELYPDDVVKLNVIHIGEIFVGKYIKEGRVCSIEATRYVSRQDQADPTDEKIKCVTICTPGKRGQTFPEAIKKSMLKYLGDENEDRKKIDSNNTLVKKVSELIAIDVEGIENLKFEIDISGTKRKLDMSDLSKMATKFDITDDVAKNEDGHPKLNSVAQCAKKIIKTDIRKLIRD